MKKIKNKEYETEINKAKNFLIENSSNNKLTIFVSDLKLSKKAHSQKWSEVYDFITLHYPNDLDVVTGLVYYIEEDD